MEVIEERAANRIAAVIVTFNRKEKLRRCIDAVLNQRTVLSMDRSESQSADKSVAGCAALDIFVIDNNSSDGTEEMMRGMASGYSGTACPGAYRSGAGRHGRIIYRNLRYNSGGAGGFCYGIREAVNAGYDRLWLMDDDCVPAEDALEAFLRFDSAHAGEYGFLTGRALWTDGSVCRMNIQRETVFRPVPADRLIRMTEPCRVEMASFVSLFIPAEVVRDIGLPLREFRIWSDDWEYTRRISRKYPCWLVPSSEALHDTDRNTGADIASAEPGRTDRFSYLYRNDVYLYRREGLRGFMYEAARLAFHTAKIAVSRNSIEEKKRRAAIMFKATAAGLRFHPVPDRAGVKINPNKSRNINQNTIFDHENENP